MGETLMPVVAGGVVGVVVGGDVEGCAVAGLAEEGPGEEDAISDGAPLPCAALGRAQLGGVAGTVGMLLELAAGGLLTGNGEE
jgi:hypothetical protein